MCVCVVSSVLPPDDVHIINLFVFHSIFQRISVPTRGFRRQCYVPSACLLQQDQKSCQTGCTAGHSSYCLSAAEDHDDDDDDNEQ